MVSPSVGRAAQATAGPRIAVSKTPLSLPFYVAQANRLFEKNGVNVQFVDCTGGFRCLNLMLEGQADMSTCSELPVIFSAFGRSDFSVVATFTSNKDDMKFIVNKELVNKGLKALKGKRVGVVPKSASQYYFDLFMLYQGIDPKSVTQVSLGPEALPQALATGVVDAISVWEPFGYLATKQSAGRAQIVKTPKLYTQTFNLTANKAYAHRQGTDIERVLKSVRDAIAMIHADPAQTKLLLKSKMGLDDAFIDYAWGTYIFDLSLRQSLITTMEGQTKWALREGYAGDAQTRPDLLGIIDPGFLTRVDPSLVDFVHR